MNNKDIIQVSNKTITKYSSDVIKRGLSLSQNINRLSSVHFNQINQLLKKINELYLLGIYWEVLSCSEKLIQIEKNCAEAWWYKSRALWKNVEYEEGLIAVEYAIFLKPKFTDALLTKSAILMDLFENYEALKIVEELIKIEPNKYKAWYNKALILRRLQKIKEADFALNQAFKIKFNSCNIEKTVNIYNFELLEEKVTKTQKNASINTSQLKNWKLIITFDSNCISSQLSSNFDKSINSIKVNLDNTIIISERNDGIIQIWNLYNTKLLHFFYRGDELFQSLKIVNKAGKNSINIINGTNLDKATSIISNNLILMGVDNSKNKPREINLWNINIIQNIVTKKLLYSLSSQSVQNNCINVNDYDIKIFAEVNEGIKIWNLKTGNLINVIEKEDLNFWSVAIAPDAQRLACTGNLCPDDFHESIDILMVFNVETGQLIYSHHTPYSEYVIFSPDGQLLAQSVEDEPVHIWNAHTGELIRTLNHPYDYISGLSDIKGLAFNEDGDILASSNCRAQINLWNPKTGEHIQTLSGSSNNKYKRYESICFSPDGNTLVAGDSHGYIDVWQLHS